MIESQPNNQPSGDNPTQMEQEITDGREPLGIEQTPNGQQSEPGQTARKFNIKQFTAGFLGWFAVNGVLWLIFAGGLVLDDYENLPLNVIVFPFNLVILAVLFRTNKTRQVAQGILTAFGLNFFISIFLGSFYGIFCLIPFFFDAP
jgi:hypothetical protein